MRREIKIRTYSEKLGKYIGEWGVFKNPIDESFQAGPPSGIQGEIYHEQFTGLLDSKGVEVYEGDIVSFVDCMDFNEKKTMPVVWYADTARFIPQELKENHKGGHYIYYWDMISDIEVIGTIHDAEYKELAK